MGRCLKCLMGKEHPRYYKFSAQQGCYMDNSSLCWGRDKNRGFYIFLFRSFHQQQYNTQNSTANYSCKQHHYFYIQSSIFHQCCIAQNNIGWGQSNHRHWLRKKEARIYFERCNIPSNIGQENWGNLIRLLYSLEVRIYFGCCNIPSNIGWDWNR